MFYFDFLSSDDSVWKILEKLNHNFNYTHTSLKKRLTGKRQNPENKWPQLLNVSTNRVEKGALLYYDKY